MKKIKNKNFSIRYNLATTIVYIIGIVLLVQLFNLQIVNGAEYREQSNTRLTRESILEAARGDITDHTGNKLATTKLGYNVELYKTKVTTNELNQSLLKLINILEQNGDKYVDELPIQINPFSFTNADEESQRKWKKNNNIDENKTAEECFNILKEEYEINADNIEDTRKIMALRYEISINGYSSTKTVTLAENISEISQLQINEQSAKLPGITVTSKPIRTYPSGTLAAHVLGNVGQISSDEYASRKDEYDINDIIGKTGIEYIFEEYLKGEDGVKQIDMSVEGAITGENVSKEAISGSDVVLTIDANLQRVAEESLRENIRKISSGEKGEAFETNSGAAVVMNVNTGEVLAMVSLPDYDPEDFVDGLSEQQSEELKNGTKSQYNRAITGSYAPGSTFKMVTALAALESGNVTVNEEIRDTGVYPHYHHPVCWIWTSNRIGHGYLNVTDAIKHSCNYFFYEMGYRMGIDTLAQYATYLGLGQKTGIELPNESAGELASKETAEKHGVQWYAGDVLSAAIGQTYNNFTPLQMVRYTSVIANGGKSIKPTIVKSIIKADGTEVPKEEVEQFVNNKLGYTPTEENYQFKEEYINAVKEGMRGVTSESGGTAYSTFKDFNIEVGGKTGSAQANDKTHAWFVGFAPFDEPEIAVVVLVENGGHGGWTAEVARDIIAEYFGMNSNTVTEDTTAVPETEVRR